MFSTSCHKNKIYLTNRHMAANCRVIVRTCRLLFLYGLNYFKVDGNGMLILPIGIAERNRFHSSNSIRIVSTPCGSMFIVVFQLTTAKILSASAFGLNPSTKSFCFVATRICFCILFYALTQSFRKDLLTPVTVG